jgi:hypothetical protein
MKKKNEKVEINLDRKRHLQFGTNARCECEAILGHSLIDSCTANYCPK